MKDQSQPNRLSVIALTLGILSLVLPFVGIPVGFIGMILALIAKKEVETTQQRGRGFAIAGFILSLAGVIIQLSVVIYGAFSVYLNM